MLDAKRKKAIKEAISSVAIIRLRMGELGQNATAFGIKCRELEADAERTYDGLRKVVAATDQNVRRRRKPLKKPAPIPAG